jgi:hypothetical protein
MLPHTKLLGDCKSGERGDYRSFEIIQNPNNEDNPRTFGRAVTSRATLFEPCFCNYIFRKVSEELMDYLNVGLRVKSVFEENGTIKRMPKHCTPHFNFNRLKGVSCAAGDFPPTVYEHPEVHITCKMELPSKMRGSSSTFASNHSQ